MKGITGMVRSLHSVLFSQLIISCMEKNKFFAIILFIAVFLVSCVKEPQDIPVGLDKDPEFNFAGIIGTQALDIEAGLNEWTILPTVVHTQSNIIYSTIFSKDGCMTNCNPSLEFRFYRELPAANNPQQDFEKTLSPGLKEYVSADIERDSFAINLSTHPGLFMSGISTWYDSNTTGISEETEFESTIGYEENLHVCFHSFAFTGCQYMQCIYYDPATLVPCISFIEPMMQDSQVVSLTVRPQGTAPFDIKWSNGSTSSTIVIPFHGNVSEIYASVRVTDALGNWSALDQLIRVQNGNLDACYFPINLISTPVINSSPALFANKVEIIYTDEN